MEDLSGISMRTRAWITKYDHSVDPPRPIEEVFIENGRIVSVTPLSTEQEEGASVERTKKSPGGL